ncbi:MAG: carbohydrate-binding protein [Deltaproteobacteria bacterium]
MLSLRVINQAGDICAEVQGESAAELACDRPYADGDILEVTSSTDQHVVLSLEPAIAPALLFLKRQSYRFAVPFGERRKTFAPDAYMGEQHLQVRTATQDEIATRRNLALNPWDEDGNQVLFPHAFDNLPQREDQRYRARHAIDGEVTNDKHGNWPCTSWGINRDATAALTLDFARQVQVDEIILTLRADFPHDAAWSHATVTFSDQSTLALPLIKTAAPQHFAFAPRLITELRLRDLIKADDPSPFPALTQIEVWGRDGPEVQHG